MSHDKKVVCTVTLSNEKITVVIPDIHDVPIVYKPYISRLMKIPCNFKTGMPDGTNLGFREFVANFSSASLPFGFSITRINLCRMMVLSHTFSHHNLSL